MRLDETRRQVRDFPIFFSFQKPPLTGQNRRFYTGRSTLEPQYPAQRHQDSRNYLDETRNRLEITFGVGHPVIQADFRGYILYIALTSLYVELNRPLRPLRADDEYLISSST